MADERRGDYINISEKLSSHGELLGRIEERQIATNQRLDKINGSVAELWGEMSSTKKRISALERWRSMLAGAWGMLVLLAGSLWKWGK